MTISYKGMAVMIPREIKIKTSVRDEGYYTGNRGITIKSEIKAQLAPNTEDATKDIVIIKGKPDVIFEGAQIKSSEQCKGLGIVWSNPAAEKTPEWSPYRYR